MDCQDFLALEGIIAVWLLLEFLDLVPERVVSDRKDLIGMLLKELCLIKFKRDIFKNKEHALVTR